MNVLIVGSGGREHALAWKIRQSPLVEKLYCAPGNAGIAGIAECVPINATDREELAKFAREHSIGLTIVGPEQPLSDGIVDTFRADGLKIFGPTKAAARIESSKAFAKEFMKKYRIPTAEFKTFTAAERYDAERYINEVPVPIVLKADGLAAGKGVAVCESKEQALEVLEVMMEQKIYGEAGSTVVIEDFLVGEEASVFALTNGRDFVTLPAAQDHKRLLDNDQGKNTGGMGAYAPAQILTDKMMEMVKRTIIRPTLHGMEKENCLYTGCLYVGLMITETGPKVVEFNCRLGDPETQVVLPLLEDDLLEVMMEAEAGTLRSTMTSKDRSAVCVVIASGGYPDRYETDKIILGLESTAREKDVIVFHHGTALTKDGTVTAGGRVLGVTALSDHLDLEGAVDKAYRAVEKITFDGAYYRSDIGKKGIQRLKHLQQSESE